MNKPQFFISAAMMRAVVGFLTEQGFDTQSLADQAGVDLAPLQDEDALIDADCYPTLMQAAIYASGRPDLGFQFGRAAKPDRWGVLGYIMSCCRTLAEAIQCQQRYQQLVGSIGTIKIEVNGPYIRLIWDTQNDPIPALAEEAIAGWIAYGRWVTGQDKVPHQVFFRHSPPPDINEYESFFKCKINFNADINGVEFPFTFLSIPLKTPDDSNKDWLFNVAEEKLSLLNNTPAFLIELKRHIAENLPRQVPDLEQTAKQFDLNPRALQRKLKKENLTFKQLLEQTRMELAIRFLQHSDYSILEITFLLGFSEQSAFTRAFKRWTGKSPGEYRRTGIKNILVD